LKENYYFLYQRFLNNACSEEELTYLFELFAAADENSLRKLIIEELTASESALLATSRESALIRKVRRKIDEKINPVNTRFRTLIYKFGATAAVVVCIISAVIFQQIPVKSRKSLTASRALTIVPGNQQATLTLANGKKIILSKSISGNLATIGRTVVNVNPLKGVSYSAYLKGSQRDTLPNTLTTSKGEQSPFALILADGSKVWLNAASSITFPTQFSASERVVKITGEAYFEVAHNRSSPFKVITDKQEIMVIGTHFNIKSYADDNLVSTTLLQGSVKVRSLSSATYSYLRPGQQSKVNRSDGQLSVSLANIEEAIAWKNGFFMFDNQRITSIMRSISRWYNVEVEYKNFSNNERFGGTFSRSSNLSDILNSLQSLGKIRFKTESRKIIVSN
jgi:transmembrane sensor